MNPQILHSDQVFCIASWQNALIVDVAGDIDLVHMKRLGRAYRELAKTYPKGIVVCSVVRDGVPVSKADARDESARFISELGDVLLRVTMVIEHRGVVAQVIRTVIRGINVVARKPKLAIFPSIEESVAAVAPLVEPRVRGGDTKVELLAAVSAVRRGYNPEAKQQRARAQQ